jgi:hypothetical protein
VHVDVVKVNPENETIEDKESLNTAVRVWIEGGPWTDNANPDFVEEKWPTWTHDYDLDCGAATFEEAVIKFTENVREKYGDYGEYSSISDRSMENAKEICLEQFLLEVKSGQ